MGDPTVRDAVADLRLLAPLVKVMAKIGTIMERRPNWKRKKGAHLCLWCLNLERVPHRSGVYIIQQGESGPIKIGFSAASIRKRMEVLQTGSPYPLRLLAIVPGSRREEAELHTQFSDLQMRRSGPGREWFRNDARLVDYAKSLLTCPPGCPHVPSADDVGGVSSSAARRAEREANPPPISAKKAERMRQTHEALREAARQTNAMSRLASMASPSAPSADAPTLATGDHRA